MSPLKKLTPSNILTMLVTSDTSHPQIGPSALLEQSPFGDHFGHTPTARLGDSLVGNVAVHTVPAEPVNIPILLAFDFTHFDMSLSKDVAIVNRPVLVITDDTSHFKMSPLEHAALLNLLVIVVTLDISRFDRSLLTEVSPMHIRVMLDTSHFETSPLNDVNILSIVVAWHAPLRQIAIERRSTANHVLASAAFHSEMTSLNEIVPAKKVTMAVTRDTSYFEMSPLKNDHSVECFVHVGDARYASPLDRTIPTLRAIALGA
jgi:hypothetical protein